MFLARTQKSVLSRDFELRDPGMRSVIVVSEKPKFLKNKLVKQGRGLPYCKLSTIRFVMVSIASILLSILPLERNIKRKNFSLSVEAPSGQS